MWNFIKRAAKLIADNSTRLLAILKGIAVVANLAIIAIGHMKHMQLDATAAS